MSGKGDAIKSIKNNWIVFVLFTEFLSYMYRSLIADGNDHPLLDIFFKMILILSILEFFLNKTEI